jgi:hypothetical protein
MLEVIMRMMIIFLIIIVLALPFQALNSPGFIISVLTIGIDFGAITMIRRQMKLQEKSE